MTTSVCLHCHSYSVFKTKWHFLMSQVSSFELQYISQQWSSAVGLCRDYTNTLPRHTSPGVRQEWQQHWWLTYFTLCLLYEIHYNWQWNRQQRCITCLNSRDKSTVCKKVTRASFQKLIISNACSRNSGRYPRNVAPSDIVLLHQIKPMCGALVLRQTSSGREGISEVMDVF